VDKILARIENVSKSVPDKLALHSDDGMYTYAQLSEASDHVAICLSNEGIGCGDRMACLFPPGSRKIIAFLGALKAGVTFVNISPDLPEAVIRELLGTLEAHAVMGPEELPAYGPKQIFPDFSEKGAILLKLDACPTDIALVSMSSGTTGVPKAIPNSRAQLSFHLKSLDAYDIEREQNILHFGQLWAVEILKSFAEGHTQYVYDPKVRGISGIIPFARRYRISFIWFYTALFREIDCSKSAPLPDLKVVLIGGEQAFSTDIEKFELLTMPGARLLAAYAASEFKAFSHFTHFHGAPISRGIVPLGRVYRDVDLRIVDADGQPVPPNTRGEIVVVSDVVPKCYLNNAERSATSFKALPSSGETAYFTGDAGFFDFDGLLHSAGRKDDQVKVRGNLVSVIEVEQVVSEIFEFSDMAVSSAVGLNGQTQLACYYVADEAADTSVAKEALREHLPSYMIPSYFHKVDKLPRSATGKVMRRKLHTLRPEGEGSTSLLPFNRQEEIVGEVFAEVLGHSNFDRQDDFFVVGGDSLSAMRVIFKLEERFKTDLPLEGLFLEGASVELIAVRMEASTHDADTVSLVPLNYSSSDKVFYVLPPLNGHLSDYLPLAEAMSASAKFIGIRFNALLSTSSSNPISLEEIGRDAATAIFDKGRGEKNLIGFSAAGVLAFETAKSLGERGHEIGILVLIDSRINTTKIGWPFFFRRFAIFVRDLSRVLRGKSNWRSRKRTAHQLLRHQVKYWQPAPISIKNSILFRTESGNIDDNQINKWRSVVGKSMEVAPISGGHTSLRDPSVATGIAQAILRRSVD
jgi:acyl-coenzyme A synthetase/AMP-(fatty) acid ligase/acyl carrier protein/surfactin synthase thioesterase subunit